MIRKLLPHRIAVIPIFDPDILNAKTKLSKAELDYAGLGLNQLRGDAKIIVPQEAKGRVDQGIVKYVGPEVRDIKVGDYVIFSGYSGTRFYLTGENEVGRETHEDLIILHEAFVFAVIDELPYTPVPGLYLKFKDADGAVMYEEASYEMAISLLRDAFLNPDWQNRISINTPQLTKEEFNVLRGG